MRTQETGSKSVLSSSSSTSSIKAGLGIIREADESPLPEIISLPKTDLGDKDGTSMFLLADFRLLQSVLPKRPTLGEVAAEFVIEAFVFVVVDSALPTASLFLPEVPDYFRPALSDLTRMRTRGQLAQISPPKLR